VTQRRASDSNAYIYLKAPGEEIYSNQRYAVAVLLTVCMI